MRAPMMTVTGRKRSPSGTEVGRAMTPPELSISPTFAGLALVSGTAHTALEPTDPKGRWEEPSRAAARFEFRFGSDDAAPSANDMDLGRRLAPSVAATIATPAHRTLIVMSMPTQTRFAAGRNHRPAALREDEPGEPIKASTSSASSSIERVFDA